MGNRRAVPGNDGPPLDPIFGSGSKIAALTAQFWAEFSRVLCERSLRRHHHCGLRRQSRLAAAAVSVMSPRGTGRSTRFLGNLGLHVIGADVSQHCRITPDHLPNLWLADHFLVRAFSLAVLLALQEKARSDAEQISRA